jgi:hypothetical protein
MRYGEQAAVQTKVVAPTTGRGSSLGAALAPADANFSGYSRSAASLELLLFDRVDDAPVAAIQSLSAHGPARCTVPGNPLDPEELRRTDARWRACNNLNLGMIYLRDNPLYSQPTNSGFGAGVRRGSRSPVLARRIIDADAESCDMGSCGRDPLTGQPQPAGIRERSV